MQPAPIDQVLPELLKRLEEGNSLVLQAPPGAGKTTRVPLALLVRHALLRAVLVKLFLDRQLVVDLGVIDSLALRIDRSLGRARDVVAELDRDALGRGRRISRPLALAVLRRMGLDGEAGPSG